MNLNSENVIPSFESNQPSQISKTKLLSFNSSFKIHLSDDNQQTNKDQSYKHPPMLSQSFKKVIDSEFKLYERLKDKLSNLQMNKQQFKEQIIVTFAPSSETQERTSSLCFEGFWKQNDQKTDVFIKVLKQNSENRDHILQNEILLQLYASEYLPDNIVKILGWLPFEEDYKYGGSIIMEKGDYDLERAVKKEILLENNNQHYIDQIVKIGMTLRLIHVTHQDLKLAQFIYFKHNECIKLTDFGSAYYEGSEVDSDIKVYNLWSPITPSYLPTQFNIFWQISIIYQQYQYEDCNRLKELYCYICYKLDSYALGLIILRILFPKYSTLRLKQLVAILSSKNLTKDLEYLAKQYKLPACDKDQIQVLEAQSKEFIQSLNASTLRISYQTSLQYLYPDPISIQLPIAKVLKLVDQNLLRRKNITQLFLDSPLRKHDYNAYFKYLLIYSDNLDDQDVLRVCDLNWMSSNFNNDRIIDIWVVYPFNYVYDKVRVKHIQPPNFNLMEFGKSLLFYPPGQEEFEYEGDHNYLETIYNALRALGVTEYEGEPFNFQKFILFLAENEIISATIGTVSGSLKFYLKKLFNIDSWLITQGISEISPEFMNKINNLLDLGCVLIVIFQEKINNKPIRQEYFVQKIFIEEYIVHAFCGIWKVEKIFNFKETPPIRMRVYAKNID